jgi:hypothetical protein
MLVPVKSMNYIDADSQNIVALYRSSSQVAVAVDSFLRSNARLLFVESWMEGYSIFI